MHLARFCFSSWRYSINGYQSQCFRFNGDFLIFDEFWEQFAATIDSNKHLSVIVDLCSESLKIKVIIIIESFGLNLLRLLMRLPCWWFDQIVSFNGKDLPGVTRSVGAPIFE